MTVLKISSDLLIYLKALLLLSGQRFCSSLLKVVPCREEEGEKSFSLSSSLAFSALERSSELSILYLIEWKHVE